MKQFITFLMALALLPAVAQVADKSVTDCNGTTNSIYAVLGAGKVLVVASKGLDCSICRNAAPGLENFATSNLAGIEVWGAMTYAFNSSRTPTCMEIGAWENSYGWNNVFAFVDDTRYWFKSNTPRYVVYDPADSSIAYEGSNRNTAYNTAQNIANSVGVNDVALKNIELVNYPGGIEVIGAGESGLEYQVISLAGSVVKQGNLDNSNFRISTVDINAGIYLVRLLDNTGEGVVRKVNVN